MPSAQPAKIATLGPRQQVHCLYALQRRAGRDMCVHLLRGLDGRALRRKHLPCSPGPWVDPRVDRRLHDYPNTRAGCNSPWRGLHRNSKAKAPTFRLCGPRRGGNTVHRGQGARRLVSNLGSAWRHGGLDKLSTRKLHATALRRGIDGDRAGRRGVGELVLQA